MWQIDTADEWGIKRLQRINLCRTYLYAHKLLIKCRGWIVHLIKSVICDVICPLWCHQQVVSCPGWDQSISNTWHLCRTPRCNRRCNAQTREYGLHALMYSSIAHIIDCIVIRETKRKNVFSSATHVGWHFSGAFLAIVILIRWHARKLPLFKSAFNLSWASM